MSIFSSIGDIFSSEASSLSQTFSDLGKAPSFGRFWNSFQGADPLMHGLIDDQSSLDDRVTGAVLGQVGAKGAATYLDKEAADPTQAAAQHLLAGLAWAGGEAALGGAGAGGGTAMGGSAGTLGAADSSVASTDLGLTAGDVGGTSSASLTSVNGVGAAGGASSGWTDYAKTVGKVLAPTVVSSLLAPKPPKAAAPIAMPDPLAQQQAQQQKILQQLARRGRASTILTSPGGSGGSLGG